MKDDGNEQTEKIFSKPFQSFLLLLDIYATFINGQKFTEDKTT